jgi:hypothetical protein
VIRSGAAGFPLGRRACAPAGFLLALVSAGIALADFEPPKWRHVREIRTEADPGEGVVRVRIDARIFAASRSDLADLRVADQAGREVPHVIRREAEETQPEILAARVFNRTYVPGKFSTLTLDFGAAAMKDTLAVRTPGENFRRRVDVAGSGDGRAWETLLEGAYLFDVREGPEGKPFRKEEVRLPPGDHRYLRVRVHLGPGDPRRLEIGEVVATRTAVKPPVLDTIPLRMTGIRELESEHSTEILLDAGSRNLPLRTLHLDFADPNFHRAVVVEGRNEERRVVALHGEDDASGRVEREVPWSHLAGGTIYRITAPEGAESGLAVKLDETPARYLRVRIRNGDDRPLEFRTARAEMVARSLLFPASPGSRYALYYGNPQARAPRYDLSHFLARLEQVRISDATPGEPRENPSFAAGDGDLPWSERHPAILWGALLLAAGALAVLIRSLARTGGAAAGNPR